MADKIKRSEFKTFINTVPSGTADYALIGDGVTTGTINYNPETLTETYVHEESGTTTIERYAPTMPIEATAKSGDEAFEFIDTLRKSRATLDDAETDIINVWLYETAVSGAYPAEQQNVSIQIDSFGGDGGAATKISYTLNFIGDPVPGMFNPTTGVFTAD